MKNNNNMKGCYPPLGQAWISVSILSLTYLVSFMDRQILILLIDPIKNDLQISDTQVSLLTGLAFAIIYTTACVPMGRLSDLWVRKYVIIGGVFFWSLMTILCGFARNFSQLFMARMGVGLGEAALTPAAYAMIGDLFPPHKLARGISIFALAGLAGGGLSLVFGGMVIGFVEQIGTLYVPLIGEMRSWQVVLLAVGGLSFLMIIPLSWMPEPKRHHKKLGSLQAGTANEPQSDAMTFAEVLKYFWGYKAFYGLFILGCAINNVAGFGLATWVPNYFIRVHDWSPSTAGVTLGTLYLIPAITGGLVAGWLADFLYGKGLRSAPFTIMVGVLPPMILLVSLFIYIPDVQMKMGILGLFYLFETTYSVLFPTVILMATPSFIRAQVSALTLLLVNLVGFGFGPLIVALVTDYVFKDNMAVGSSILTVGVSAYSIGGMVLFFALKPFKARVMAITEEAPQSVAERNVSS
ncbi:MFS transporter [Paremcibacter congregatus]|uniref:Major facilitator superfamily (MFS) profile domain-containing protein n=1 Tax=Paremcibacter congregatus TaxID=2043170 RepID=A0A2G4YR38_9PROT|nr:MFS transporter [Paremcibacter congregatus]PHZ84789.1 hypothetical protein CRD36_10195 [Paremcibacter congregatus]QDE26241.1 MFS transporter [Paremcibacter congregatus]